MAQFALAMLIGCPTGFNPATEASKDKIEIAGATGGFAGLGIEVTGGDSVIGMGVGNSVTIWGVTGLTAADFLFVA